MKTSANSDTGFQNDADKYAAYLETPEGRLRLDLAFANLQEFLPARQNNNSLCVLDLGCGASAAAIRLARLGIHVTMLDSSVAMLDLARRAALEEGISEQVTLKHGDATELLRRFSAGSFDGILCHNLLEYVDDPGAVLRGLVRLMRGPAAIVSILVHNQPGEVLKAAIRTGDLARAEAALTAEFGKEPLYRGKVRLFTSDSLEAMLREASLTIIALRGVRTVADYLPPQISLSAEYEPILDLERKLGMRAEFAAIARYTQCLARPISTLSLGDQ
jgi:S-adenosylmethionine-dependent methyltransferase